MTDARVPVAPGPLDGRRARTARTASAGLRTRLAFPAVPGSRRGRSARRDRSARCGLGSRLMSNTSDRENTARRGWPTLPRTTPSRPASMAPPRTRRARRRASFRRRRCRPAQHLLDRGRQQAGVGAQRLQLLGMLDEREQPAGDRVARGVGTGGEQQAEEQCRARCRRASADRRPATSRARRPTACRRSDRRAFRRSAPWPYSNMRATRGLASSVASKALREPRKSKCVLDRIRTASADRSGHTEQDADGLHRQLGGDVDQEVERSRRRRPPSSSTACGGAARSRADRSSAA